MPKAKITNRNERRANPKFLKEEPTIKNEHKSFLALMIAVGFAYFSFGAITNVAGAIVPKIRETYDVSASLSTFLAAVFFIAYGITSIPWGVFMERSGKKITLILSSTITTAGVALFALIPSFNMNMLSMFLCGIGITGIQVALNPLVSEISDPSKYSRNLTLFMVINGFGSYAAPQLVTLIKNQGLHWSTTYWVFTAISLIMLAAVAAPKYPKEKFSAHHDINNKEEVANVAPSGEVAAMSAAASEDTIAVKNYTWDLLSSKPLIYLYALGIFLYVGVEVGVANTLGFLLEDKFHISMLLGDAAEASKNTVISNYWGGLLIGRLLGSAVLDRISSKNAIKIYISLAALSLFLALSGDLNQALWAFPAVGFFISIMFPSIYSLATNSFPKEYSGSVSAVLCTAIIGGAVIGPAIAAVAEAFQATSLVPNWDAGLMVAFACYAYIFALGIFAKEEKPC